MKNPKRTIEIVVLILASSLMASKESNFCTDGKKGLNCIYETEQACEEEKSSGEFCIVNPRKMDVQGEKDTFLNPSENKTPLCYGSFLGKVCLSYPQHICNEEERRIDVDFSCDSNY